MREIRSYGTVGEPVGNHRLYPENRSQPAGNFNDCGTELLEAPGKLLPHTQGKPPVPTNGLTQRPNSPGCTVVLSRPGLALTTRS